MNQDNKVRLKVKPNEKYPERQVRRAHHITEGDPHTGGACQMINIQKDIINIQRDKQKALTTLLRVTRTPGVCQMINIQRNMINIQKDMIHTQKDLINIQRNMINIQRDKQLGTHHITEGDPHTSGTSRWV